MFIAILAIIILGSSICYAGYQFSLIVKQRTTGVAPITTPVVNSAATIAINPTPTVGTIPTVALTATPTPTDCPTNSSNPTITSISQFLPTQNQTITISGTGFGTQPPFTNATSWYLSIEDVTDSNWQAGYGHDSVGVNVSVWTNCQIVITGFTGYYGAVGGDCNGCVWQFSPGDTVNISVGNVQSGVWSAQFTTTVGS